MQQFTVNITNDNIIECTEIFKMIISTEEVWCGLTSSSNSAQITIIDDDGKDLYLFI